MSSLFLKSAMRSMRLPLTIKPASSSPLALVQARCCHHAAANSIRPLGPKNAVPQFKGQAVVDGEIKGISYNEYKDKWLVFFFYPLDFTFVCPTEIIAFSDRAEEFRKLGTEVIACSCDSPFSHLAWINTQREDGGLGKMNIPVLSDYSKQIASNFGVLDTESGLSYRGLFLVDPKGIIRHTLVNDLPVGRSILQLKNMRTPIFFIRRHFSSEVPKASYDLKELVEKVEKNSALRLEKIGAEMKGDLKSVEGKLEGKIDGISHKVGVYAALAGAGISLALKFVYDSTTKK